jgi:hypothetical protein
LPILCCVEGILARIAGPTPNVLFPQLTSV